jgi:hypothetical protein
MAKAAAMIVFPLGIKIILCINELNKNIIIIIIEAIACTKKYLIADSVE